MFIPDLLGIENGVHSMRRQQSRISILGCIAASLHFDCQYSSLLLFPSALFPGVCLCFTFHIPCTRVFIVLKLPALLSLFSPERSSFYRIIQ